MSRDARQEDRLNYWRETLSPLPEPLELPGDFARTHTFDFQGGNTALSLSPALTEACDAFCKEKGVSPYMFFLSAFGVLLSRLIIQRAEHRCCDLKIGMPVHRKSM